MRWQKIDIGLCPQFLTELLKPLIGWAGAWRLKWQVGEVLWDWHSLDRQYQSEFNCRSLGWCHTQLLREKPPHTGNQTSQQWSVLCSSKGDTQEETHRRELDFPYAGGRLFFFLIYRQQQGWHSDVMTGENHGQRVEQVLVSALPPDSEAIPVTKLCTSDEKLMRPAQLIDQVIE